MHLPFRPIQLSIISYSAPADGARGGTPNTSRSYALRVDSDVELGEIDYKTIFHSQPILRNTIEVLGGKEA